LAELLPSAQIAGSQLAVVSLYKGWDGFKISSVESGFNLENIFF
jgi:hypothetical protein